MKNPWADINHGSWASIVCDECGVDETVLSKDFEEAWKRFYEIHKGHKANKLDL